MHVNPLKNLYNELMIIAQHSVIKYKDLVESNETLDSRKNGDLYIRAMRKEDSFHSYINYDKTIIANILNITDEETINRIHNNRNLIPENYRETIHREQRLHFINNYIEKNNYYRSLMGLPNLEETAIDFIYLDEPTYNELGVPLNTPLHLLPESKIYQLRSSGKLDKIISSNKNKKYLHYLGDGIDVVTLRTSPNFGIMRLPYNISDVLKKDFTMIYEQCREYYMSCIYVGMHKNIMTYYDNFIAMCIMIMAMLQTITRTIKNVINRDFFDDNSIRILFETYGVPYNLSMDTDTKKRLTQNLNLLIQNKGTNKVIYDISNILGYDRLKMFKYYLVKEQRFDEEGFPVIATKMNDFNEQVPDYEAMYNIYFQRVAVDDVDVNRAIMDPANKVKYKEITENDPFWVEDNELFKELYETEYNYVESKYMGISISYKMSRLLFENGYFFKMIFDRKDELSSINLDLPKVSDSAVNIFDAVVILCAIVCKMNRLKGEILIDPSKILHVMGFNFHKSFALIKEDILNNPFIDNELNKYFSVDPVGLTASKVNRLYNNLNSLHSELTKKMLSSKDIDTYLAYEKLYKSIFITLENREMFNLGTSGNPEYPRTFMDYLQSKNISVYNIIKNAENAQLADLVNHIVFRINLIIPELKHLGISTSDSSNMEGLLLELVRFFKSYTTDLLGLNTIFVFDLQPETIFRLIDEMRIKKQRDINDENFLSLLENIYFKNKHRLVDDGNIYIRDNLSISRVILSQVDSLKYRDSFKSIISKIILLSNMKYGDKVAYISKELAMKDKASFKEKILTKIILRMSKEFSKLKDDIAIKGSKISVNEDFVSLVEEIRPKVKYQFKENFLLRDNLTIKK